MNVTHHTAVLSKKSTIKQWPDLIHLMKNWAIYNLRAHLVSTGGFEPPIPRDDSTGASHFSRFEVRLFINRQIMNFGFWNKNVVQIIADYVYLHMTYHTYIWNHAGWHRSVLNMTHFQLFAWFGQTLLLSKKNGEKSKLFILDTFGSKTNFQWPRWFWSMCSYQFSSATRCKVSTGQKMSRKTDFQ